MAKKILLLGLVLVSFFTQAQEKRLDGKITNNKDVEGIHILNRSSRFNSVTNSEGEFYITVKPLDTLVVSSIVYVPEHVVVTKEIFESGYLAVTLEELITELDAVELGPRLSGNLQLDIQNIEILDTLNFDDVGIPGFKGEPEEKIAPVVPIIPLSVNLEALYKHLSGYYRKLRLKRKWDDENVMVSHMIHHYTPSFFAEAYEIPKERLFDFLLFCIETSSIKNDFVNENYNLVLAIFDEKSEEYVSRLNEK